MLKNARQVLEIEARAIRDLANRLDDRFLKAVEILGNCRGRVVVTGMGKSGLIGSKIAATLASTGTPALFLHPAEALHGDIGMVTEQDVVLAISNSGETEEILRLVNFLQRLSIPMISLLGRRESTLARYSAVVLDVSIQQEACPLGLAPTASTTAALALGDALAMTLSQKKGFTSEDFAVRHPGGELGKSLLKVESLMHTGDAIPRISPTTPMREALVEMSEKGFGMTTVIDGAGRIVGIITDGDLRRVLLHGVNILDRPATECMTPDPLTIGRND
ncbi:MAG: KpsF/GutQ family sugar-phosphate isomerase, partial [Acidobacteriota bacterium]